MIAAVGAFIAGSLVFPGLPRILQGKRLDFERFLDEDEWDEFDRRRLRQKLKQMHKAKFVRIYQIGDDYVVQITKKGRRKLLRHKLDDLVIERPKKWDGKWRIITYDIPKESAGNSSRDVFRRTLKNLGFLQLQRSVYLYPHPCQEVVEFVREFYGIGEYVALLTVGYLENEEVYREYFGL